IPGVARPPGIEGQPDDRDRTRAIVRAPGARYTGRARHNRRDGIAPGEAVKSVTSRYREAWEGFWSEAPGEEGAVFWDAEPALTAARHLALFEPHLLDPGLPLVDLGCGNGTQTR